LYSAWMIVKSLNLLSNDASCVIAILTKVGRYFKRDLLNSVAQIRLSRTITIVGETYNGCLRRGRKKQGHGGQWC
jgi:hypothetical protein